MFSNTDPGCADNKLNNDLNQSYLTVLFTVPCKEWLYTPVGLFQSWVSTSTPVRKTSSASAQMRKYHILMLQSTYRTSNKLAKWMKSLAPSEILYPFSYVYDNVNVMLPLRILVVQWECLTPTQYLHDSSTASFHNLYLFGHHMAPSNG